jgi:plastocyanin
MSTSTGTRADGNHRGIRTIPAMIGVIVAVILSVLGVGVVANAADRLTISITNTFSPANVTINVGTTVTWTNNDSNQHELRSNSGPTEFRTDTLDSGQSATFTFNTIGTYTYNDHRNDQSTAYTGTIVVTDGVTPPTPPAGGTTPPPAATPAPPTTASVQLAGAQFSPTSVTVGVGGTVTWLNNDGTKHTVTADDASFDSGTLIAGATFVHTFATAGTYAYGCNFHGNMRGTVIVVGASGTPPPAAAPPAAPAPAPPAPVAAPPVTPVAVPPVAGATNESVSIANNLFSPSTITVNAGSTVTWANSDTVTHTITADDQSFTSGLLKKATSWSQTFATPGTFTYFCEIHPTMTGTVIALAADGSAPAAVPAAATIAAAPIAATTAAVPSAGGSAAPGSSAAATGTIAINDAGFTPASLRVAVGGTVTFANNGKAMHTVTATNGSFDSSMIKSGATWVHTFPTAGSFTYNCILHPSMKGTIEVVGAGNSTEAAGAASAAPTGQTESAPTTTAATPTDSAIQPVTVDVADNEFKPNHAIVAVGGTVTWTLVGAAAHTITADDQSFNSGLMKPGESYSSTFSTLGSFTYTCLIHPGMKGTIEVVPPEQAAAQQGAPVAGGTPQAQQAASQPGAIAATGPAHTTSMWRDTLLGIAAVLLACCALVFALKSFLKILGSDEPAESLTPNPV